MQGKIKSLLTRAVYHLQGNGPCLLPACLRDMLVPEDVNEPPNLPSPSHSFPSCPVTQLLSPRAISVSNKPYWDSYLGFHPWALAFLLPSLPSSFPQILLWDKHCAYGGCIWASQPQLPLLRWIFPVLRLWCQQNKRLVSWTLQAQPFCFGCGRHRMDPQLPAQAHQKTRASQGRRAPREPLTLIALLELCHLYFGVFLLQVEQEGSGSHQGPPPPPAQHLHPPFLFCPREVPAMQVTVTLLGSLPAPSCRGTLGSVWLLP